MPCRFASSGTVATSRRASRATLASNAASNFLRDLVIYGLHRLRQSRTLHTLTSGSIFGVHFILPTETVGKFRFTDIAQDEIRMSTVFEEFVRSFYRAEQCDFEVTRPQIAWMASDMTEADEAYLPVMKTDIYLEGP